MNFAAVLAEHARTRGARPALVEGARVIDHRGFDLRVRRIAADLNAQGIGRGTIVGIALRDRIEHLLSIYAVACAGAAVLPLDWRWRREEIERAAGFFGAALVLIEPGVQLEGVRTAVVDADWQRSVESEPALAGYPDDGQAPAILSLSSGTTGRPKGPMLSHDQFVARFLFQQKTLGMSGADRYLSATPLYFGAGRGLAMGCLHAGGAVVLFPPPYEPPALVEAAASNRASVLLLVPTLLRRLLEHARAE
ncbi:MAG: AMP-binding protein, partial [Burkholderiales bacterium]